MTVEQAARKVLERLPDELQEELEGLRIVVMRRPSLGLVEEGISATTPAAFVRRGEEPFFDGDDEQDRVVYFFTDNIRPLSELRVEQLMLHEVGHALGMDEAEVRDACGEVPW